MPDEETIRSVQKIAWSAAAGSADLLNASPEEIRAAIREVSPTCLLPPYSLSHASMGFCW